MLGCNSSTNNICRCTDRCCTSTDICSHGKCPCQSGKVYPLCYGKTLDNRNHGCCKRNIIYKGTGNSGTPDDNSDHQLDISSADFGDQSCDHFQHTGLLQTTYYNKQSNKEQQRLVIYLFHQLYSFLTRCDQCQDGYAKSDGCNGKSCLCMCYKKNYCKCKDNAADGKALLIPDGCFGIRECGCIYSSVTTELLMEYEEEINHGKYQCTNNDQSRITDKISK